MYVHMYIHIPHPTISLFPYDLHSQIGKVRVVVVYVPVCLYVCAGRGGGLTFTRKKNHIMAGPSKKHLCL